MVKVHPESQSTEVLCAHDGLLVGIFRTDIETGAVVTT